MDLISRQAAIDTLESGKDKTAKGDIGGFYNAIIQNDIDKLRNLPSAQPEVTEEAVKDYCRKRCLTIMTNDYFYKLTSAQPEIIRCKDCKHYKTEFCAIDIWTDEGKIYKARPDDFIPMAVYAALSE